MEGRAPSCPKHWAPAARHPPLGLVVTGSCGQRDANRSAARAGIDVNATVVIEHGPYDDRQTQSHAARFCRTERREYLLAHFWRNPAADVLHRNEHGAVAAAFVTRLGRKCDLRFF